MTAETPFPMSRPPSDLRAFLTGSRVYGTPREDSDVDMVVFLSREEVVTLRGLGEQLEPALGGYDVTTESFPLRFGRLNLLVCLTEAAYNTWRAGTDALVAQFAAGDTPTRDEAIAVFRKLRGHSGGAS